MDRRWDIDGLSYRCEASVHYPANDCWIQAGAVVGHPTDTVYISLSKEHDESKTVFVILREDEMLALIHVCAATLHALAQSAPAEESANAS